MTTEIQAAAAEIAREEFEAQKLAVINLLRELRKKPEYNPSGHTEYEVIWSSFGKVSTYVGFGDLEDDEIAFRVGAADKVIKEVGYDELRKLDSYPTSLTTLS